MDSLTASVFTRADETIPEDLPASDLVFRIYRDVRFSKDQTPYKAHFSAAWSRTGRKGPYAGYYVHLEPGGKCFVGGGLWHPERDALQRLRLSIDQHPERWRSLLLRDEIVRVFYPGPAEAARKKEASKSRKQSSDTQLVLEAARKAFADMNKEDALKKCPKVGLLARCAVPSGISTLTWSLYLQGFQSEP